MPGLTPLTTAYDFGNNLKRTMSAPVEKHQTDGDILTRSKIATNSKEELSVKGLDHVTEIPEDGVVAGGVKLTGAGSDGGEQSSSPVSSSNGSKIMPQWGGKTRAFAKNTFGRARHGTWGTAVTAENAQTIFSPDFLVFVANLRSDASLDELCVALSGIFPRFGPCTIRTVYSNNGMNIAFVQYSKKIHAENAIAQANGVAVMGRPCRVEKAEAPRTLFISKYTGQRVSVAEAIQLCSVFGPIQFWWEPTLTERHLHNLPLGVFCTFEIYNHYQAAQKALSRHHIYNVANRQEYKSKGRHGAAAPVAAPFTTPAVLSFLPFSVVSQMYIQATELQRSGMVAGDFSVAIPAFVARQ
ncbi:hypothetical protein LTS18_010514 [Coniosporium uncinatum]|uniref:Uncharacterized protein n=1 Tax=Coniosporium uncinatum TaxID=93489 RepID=A0ACC3DC78_9PEZI|nr:hypothetical protein LTS18_010514 [Coniosporium uncinatum]